MHPRLAQLLARSGIDAAAGPPTTEAWRALLAALEAESAAPASAEDAGAALAAASHDVRTPLNELLGLAQLLQQQQLPREQAASVDDIAHAAEQVLAVVDQLLDYAALQSGRLVLEPVAFDPRELVDAALAELSLAGSALPALSVHVGDSVPAVLVGDAPRIRQVLLHALRAGLPLAGESATLVVAGHERQDGRLSLSFELRGARSAGATVAPAANLSRAVAERLAALLGGALEVRDPAEAGVLVLASAACARVQAAGADEEELRGLVVLLAHRDAERLVELERCAAGWGARPLAARDAAGALTALRETVHRGTPADLGVIDLELSGTDGLELARRVRSDPLLATMPLVVLEGAASSAARETAVAGLFDARLERSVGGAELAACLAGLYRTPHAELLKRRRQAGATVAARPAPPAVAAAPAMRGTGNVLVVEDVASNALVARRMLEGAGLTVTTCSNGAEALQALAHKHFEIALVDCEMPVMDGYEATREIRRREQGSNRHQVIIALTANVMPGDRKRCLDAGMDDYVAKPLRADDLLRLIDEWLPWALAHRELERSGRT